MEKAHFGGVWGQNIITCRNLPLHIHVLSGPILAPLLLRNFDTLVVRIGGLHGLHGHDGSMQLQLLPLLQVSQVQFKNAWQAIL